MIDLIVNNKACRPLFSRKKDAQTIALLVYICVLLEKTKYFRRKWKKEPYSN